MGSQGNGVVSADDALIVQGQAACQIESARHRAEVAGGVGSGAGEALVVVGTKTGEHRAGLRQGGSASEAKFADQAVLKGAPSALDAALGLGRVGRDLLDAEQFESASELCRSLFTSELLGEGPVGIVALEDAVAVTVEAERDAVSEDHGLQGAEIPHGIFWFELKVSGKDPTGGVILKADESELGAAAFEPIMTTGIGEYHHAEPWTRRTATAISARPAFLRRDQFGGPQDAPHGLAADGELLLDTELLGQMGVVEAPVLAPGEIQDQLLLGNRNTPRHGASAIAVLHPAHGVGPVATLEPLYLPFTQLEQEGGFAYAQPPSCCVLNHLHALELLLTHGHHPCRVTK